MDQNFYRSPESVFVHLVETIGPLSLLASRKAKPGFAPDVFLPKALAWWMSLCGRVGVASVEDLIWRKFPFICPYCLRGVHNDAECKDMKRLSGGRIDWDELELRGRFSESRKPRGLEEWQGMFGAIYPPRVDEAIADTVVRVTEELGELAEAIRALPHSPGYFLSEAADLFAWLMHLQNQLDGLVDGSPPLAPSLDTAMSDLYPERCSHCLRLVCQCPPVLFETLGRMAKEVPLPSGAPRGYGLASEGEFRGLVERGDQEVVVGSTSFPVDSRLVREARSLAVRISCARALDGQTLMSGNLALAAAVGAVLDYTESQRITSLSLRQLTESVGALDAAARGTVLSELLNPNGYSSEAIKAIVERWID